MIWKLKALGVGNSSRQGAKSPSLDGKDENFLRMICTRNLRVFAAFASLRETLRDFVEAFSKTFTPRPQRRCGAISDPWFLLAKLVKIASPGRVTQVPQKVR